MGYYTYWNGTIMLKDKKAIALVRYLLKEEIAPFQEVSGIQPAGFPPNGGIVLPCFPLQK